MQGLTIASFVPMLLVACPGRFAEGRTTFRIPQPNGVLVARRSQWLRPSGLKTRAVTSRILPSHHQTCDLPSGLGVP